METKRLMRSFLKIAMTAFLVFLSGNAFAIENSTRVVSPYWQVDSGSYSFIAVSHSSLSGMNSQIGVKITALDNSGTSYGTAQTFTIASGGTQRVFIVPTSHASINPTSITASDATFIRGTTTYTYGSILIDPVASNPEIIFLNHRKNPTEDTADIIPTGGNEGSRDSTTLGYWGSVIIEANTTGFAMEFIGDMNDSKSGSTTGVECLTKVDRGSTTTHRMCPSSGVNLQ